MVGTEAEQWRIIRECHEGTGNSVEAKAMSCHFGRDKTVALIQSKVYFQGFRQKIICHAHVSLGVTQSETEHSIGGCFKLL